MNDEEHSCLLRRLTLCDTTTVLTLVPGQAAKCYCAALASALARGSALEAGEARTARARSVARAGEIHRRTTQRQNWLRAEL